MSSCHMTWTQLLYAHPYLFLIDRSRFHKIHFFDPRRSTSTHLVLLHHHRVARCLSLAPLLSFTSILQSSYRPITLDSTSIPLQLHFFASSTSIRFVSFTIFTSLLALARSIPFTPHAAHSLLTFGSPTIGAFDHTVESSSSPFRFRPYFVICFPHHRLPFLFLPAVAG